MRSRLPLASISLAPSSTSFMNTDTTGGVRAAEGAAATSITSVPGPLPSAATEPMSKVAFQSACASTSKLAGLAPRYCSDTALLSSLRGMSTAFTVRSVPAAACCHMWVNRPAASAPASGATTITGRLPTWPRAICLEPTCWPLAEPPITMSGSVDALSAAWTASPGCAAGAAPLPSAVRICGRLPARSSATPTRQAVSYTVGSALLDGIWITGAVGSEDQAVLRSRMAEPS